MQNLVFDLMKNSCCPKPSHVRGGQRCKFSPMAGRGPILTPTYFQEQGNIPASPECLPSAPIIEGLDLSMMKAGSK